MPPRCRCLFLLSAVSLGLWCALPAGRLAPRPVAAAATPAAGKGKHWLGVASWAAMAGHHGNGPQGSAGSEYSTWVTYDPHARAYQALFNKLSKQIATNLRSDVKPEANPLCLKCHSMQADAKVQGPRFTLIDGVGCESCHG